LHEGHKVLLYNKIYDEKKMREYYRKAIKLAEAKIEYNRKVCSMINKEIKKNEKVKSLKKQNEVNESENKNILEAINIFHELYDISKPKNYCLIVNLVDNINFNLERIKFEKNTSKEKDAEDLSNYFKADFILESLNKKEVPATLEEQFFNDKFNVQFEEENKEKKENEDKNEQKKEETKEAEELKKDEEEDDGREKTLAEKKEIIKKKINEKGGFQQAASNPVGNSNEAPKTTNDNVVNILNSQTINKKVKKKPKKINFQS
jgi:cell division protein ZapA (FtsZ GTPase activity inhibitor)